MLPKVEELLNQYLNTKDEDVRKKCLYDLLDYQILDETIDDFYTHADILTKQAAHLRTVAASLAFHKQLIERE